MLPIEYIAVAEMLIMSRKFQIFLESSPRLLCLLKMAVRI